MIAVSIHDVRVNLAELVNRVAYGREDRVRILRHGKHVATIISAADEVEGIESIVPHG